MVGLIDNETSNLCNNSSIKNIFIEYIPYKLPDLGALNYEDSIYVLFQCANGLKVLKEKYSVFIIDEELIGFNYLGICKLWINPNYHLNRN